MSTHNIFLQLCSIVSCAFMSFVLVLTLIPSMQFEIEVDHPNIFRIGIIILIFGTIQGIY